MSTSELLLGSDTLRRGEGDSLVTTEKEVHSELFVLRTSFVVSHICDGDPS